MLKTHNLSKVFYSGFLRKKIKALDNLNLHIKPNEIFGYLGPNAAGKTTSIKLFLGLLKPSSGKIEIFDKQPDCEIVRSRIGYMPENPYFYDYLTAWELLDYYGQLCGIKKISRRKKIEELLGMLELEEFKTMPLRNFSKGMLQRLGIAQALINDPDLVILDEPMAGLDPEGRKKIRDIIVGLKARGKTVFFSTHILWDVELICDRVGILVAGQLRQEDELDRMLEGEVIFTEMVLENVTQRGMQQLRDNFSSITERGNKVLVQAVDDQGKELALALAGQKELKIFSMMPQRKSLEEIFIKEVEKNRAGR